MIPDLSFLRPQLLEAGDDEACGVVDSITGSVCNRAVHRDNRHQDTSSWDVHVFWDGTPEAIVAV